MFDGEFESLKALHSTQTVRVPQPIKVGVKTSPGWWFSNAMKNTYLHIHG